MCVQHVVNAVVVEKSEIIEETVLRMKHTIQAKINQVSRDVETLLLQIVEKTIEIPELQFTDMVDIPVVTQRQIRMNPDVQKTVEISQLQHTDDVVDVPVQFVAQVSRVEVVEIPQLQAVKKIGVIPETCETCVKDNMFMRRRAESSSTAPQHPKPTAA